MRSIARAISWAVIIAAVAVVAAAVVVPRLGGATPYTILTGSMRPGLPPGTLVVVKPVDPAEIGIGAVVTYQLESGEPTVVTHRVVAQGFAADGKPIFRTQGDANDVPDEKWVRAVQVRGEKWYSVPYLGYASQLLTGHERQLVVYGVVGGLFVYAATMFASSAFERRRRVRKVPAHVAA